MMCVINMHILANAARWPWVSCSLLYLHHLENYQNWKWREVNIGFWVSLEKPVTVYALMNFLQAFNSAEKP